MPIILRLRKKAVAKTIMIVHKKLTGADASFFPSNFLYK